MSQTFETGYNRFLSKLQKKLGPVDIKLVTTLMDLERKISNSHYPQIGPRVNLTIRYKPGVNRETKIFEMRSKFGMASSLDVPNEILVLGYMNLNDIMELSSDSDIEKIIGKATVVIRG